MELWILVALEKKPSWLEFLLEKEAYNSFNVLT